MRWNNDEQIEVFREMWVGRGPCHMDHSPDAWNKRAHGWEEGLRNDAARKKRSENRIANVTKFLIDNGALEENYDVIDIGCGPGRFVAEFAKHAKTAAGTDLSDQMCEYGMRYAKEQGLSNVSFTACDFKSADLKTMGWEKAFDLVFSCTTPAMNSADSAKKAMAMSRKWVLNGNFTDILDGILKDVAANVPEAVYVPKWNGLTSYALFNMLWLKGYSPLIGYYHENSRESYNPDPETAERLAQNLNLPPEQAKIAAPAILEYLKKQYDIKGSLEYDFNCTYCWILWDVTCQSDRSSYNREENSPELKPADLGRCSQSGQKI